MKKSVIYARYSSTRQDNGFSIEEQVASCKSKAEHEQSEIVRIFEERAISAKDLNRPALIELINFVCDKKNQIDSIYIYDVSRLSRNAVDLGLIKRDFAKHGIVIRPVNGVSDDSLEGNMIMGVLGNVAEYENSLRAAKVKSGMKRRFLQGYALVCPNGYKWQRDDNGRPIIIPDPETFTIYQQLWYKVRDEHLTLAQALSFINKKLPKKRLRRQTLSGMFENKLYMGTLAYPKYPGEEVKGLHKPMIDEATFWKVRAIITGRKYNKAKTRHKINPDYPLTKILFCPTCNAKITAAKSKGNTKSYEYYFCRNRRTCKYNKQVKDAHIAFMAKLESLVPTDEMLQYINEKLREKYEATLNDLTYSASDVEKEIKNLTERKDKLLEKLLDEIITNEDYKANVAKIDAEITGCKVLLSEKQLDKLDIEAVINFVNFYFKNLHKIWERFPIEVQLALQSSTFPKGVYYEKNVCRTPEISLVYDIKRLLSKSSEPDNSYVELFGLKDKLFESYLDVYRQMNPLLMQYQESFQNYSSLAA